ncbi:hypothetical protein, partial [Klebsiella pneumoniae]|uniref:hypothetical protein n=1 Tax=Klebsiella pneumoniae TaxID=573 RepID=UPI00272F2CD3
NTSTLNTIDKKYKFIEIFWAFFNRKLNFTFHTNGDTSNFKNILMLFKLGCPGSSLLHMGFL